MTQPDVLGQPLWYELMTTDPKAAEAFYPAVTGWSPAPFPGLDMPYMLWMRGAPLAGLMLLPDDAKKAGGGQVLNGPMEVPGGDWIAQCLDPQGAAFAVHQTKA